MFKVWKGRELEGEDKGIMTMFVECPKVEGDTILKYLKQHPDCKRLYLGAGRVDVTYAEELEVLTDYCSVNNIPIVVETDIKGLDSMPDDLFDLCDQTIVRIMNPRLKLLASTDCIKVDTTKDVYVKPLGEMINTSLKELHGDTFETDTLIFEYKEEN